MKRSITVAFLLAGAVLACNGLSSAAQSPATAQTVPSTAASAPVATSTPRPIPAPIQCSDDLGLTACLTRIQAVLPKTYVEPLIGVYAGGNIDLNLLYYDVHNGHLGEAQTLHVPEAFKSMQQDTVAQKNVWSFAAGILPPDELKWITRFEIFSSSYYAAWVEPGGPDHEDRSQWVLGVDLADAQDPVDLTYILVHEYGHMITLNTQQIQSTAYYYGWEQDSRACPQFMTPDGCSARNSYIDRFYQEFWKSILPEWVKDVDRPKVNSSEEYRALVQRFYDKHPREFVDEYAATNINEDLAESFMQFVLSSKPGDSSPPSMKIRFFYDFPELVSLRSAMIQNICAYTE